MQITDNPELVYKTFLLHNKKIDGKNKTKRIMFDNELPDKLTEEDSLRESYNTLRMQGGEDSDEVLARVNPSMFRDLNYMCVVSADAMNPLSDEIERQFNLEVYDRAINNPVADQEAIFELLLESTPTTQKDPKKFIKKQEIMQNNQLPGQNQQQPNQSSPINSLLNNTNSVQPIKLP